MASDRPPMTNEVAAGILYYCIVTTLREMGADVTSHPFDVLSTSGQEMWLRAWDKLVGEIGGRDYVFAHWPTLRQMVEGDPVQAMWREALRELPPHDADAEIKDVGE